MCVSLFVGAFALATASVAQPPLQPGMRDCHPGKYQYKGNKLRHVWCWFGWFGAIVINLSVPVNPLAALLVVTLAS